MRNTTKNCVYNYSRQGKPLLSLIKLQISEKGIIKCKQQLS